MSTNPPNKILKLKRKNGVPLDSPRVPIVTVLENLLVAEVIEIRKAILEQTTTTNEKGETFKITGAQKEIANKMRLSQTEICNILNGKRDAKITPLTIEKALHYLVSVGYKIKYLHILFEEGKIDKRFFAHDRG